jgi:cysteine desulfurase / selenocysteine lyase
MNHDSPAGHEVRPFDVERVREDFPILRTLVHGRPLAYLDNAATTQKPQAVIDRITLSYAEQNANVHRGVHLLSERATEAFENARIKVQRFLHAPDRREVVFVRGTTEAINLVAQTYGRTHVRAGDEIIVSEMEHHSNIVPWQMLCEQTGARLRVIPITEAGELDLVAFESLLTERTKLVAIVHVSNALWTINPVETIVRRSHEQGVPVLVDGAQAVAHLKIDVQELGCDFYALSGHKVFGPTGIGVLWGRLPLLESMPPYQGGGDMINAVTFEKTTYQGLPHRFEAGTPHITGAIGLGAAVDYLGQLDLAGMRAHEENLLAHGTDELSHIPGLRLLGGAKRRAGILTFVMDGIHAHDIGTILDQDGVAIRTGHHCAQPLMDRLGVPATARASLALYNTRAEVDALAAALAKARRILG